jgi:hypothetical protein
MRGYYKQLKANDEFISFIFITGVTKFSKLSLFSAFNSFEDISIDPKYAAITGFTHEEIIKYFPDHIKKTAATLKIDEDTALQKIRDYYSGFCFDGDTRVYNPFSTLLYFKSTTKEFENYWFSTGSPECLAKFMKENHLTAEEFRGLRITKHLAKDPGEMSAEKAWSYLYQSGYLSLRRVPSEAGFSLDYPNREVLESMSELVMYSIFGDEVKFALAKEVLIKALKNRSPGEVV